MELASGTVRIQWHRSKALAILLAVLFGPCPWLYTFKKDSWKAALAFGINLFLLLFVVSAWFVESKAAQSVPPGAFYDGGFATIGAAFWFVDIAAATWLASIVDTACKSRQWYASDGPVVFTKTVALLLAILAGPWTWLYTRRRDLVYFLVTLPVVLGVWIISFITGSFTGWALFLSFVSWLVPLIMAVKRSQGWYASISPTPGK